MGRHEIHRGASVLLLALLLLPGLALAEEPVEVPDWAEGWKQTWLEASKNGSVQLTGKLSPRLVGPGKQQVFAVLELRSLTFPPGDHPPASVALIIDRSASTEGRRLLIARKAAQEVIAGLSERDHLAIILVSDRPDVLSRQPVTAEARAEMKAYVEKTRAVGRSDLSAGLEAAFEELSKPAEQSFYRQVILLSDGRPTDGMVDPDGLAALAREAREQHSIHVSTVAIGEDADFPLMAGIAKGGWGFAARLNDSSVAARVSKRRELELVRRAATATELRVKVGPTVNLLGVLGHDAVLEGDTATLSIGELGSGEVLRIVLHLSTDNVGKQVRPIELAQVELQYQDALTERRRTQSLPLKVELNPAKARGRGALDIEALRHSARAIVERHAARADETAEDGDLPAAKKILVETRETLRRMGRHARLEITKALVLLDKRSRQLLGQKRVAPTSKQPSKKKQ